MLKTFLRLMSIKPILVMFVILVGSIIVGSYLAYDHYVVKEPPVELVKSRLWNRLEDKSHQSKFDDGLKLAEEKDVAAALVAMNKEYDSATTWQMMYQFFGEHLWQAEQMLKSSDPQKQQDALKIMSEVANRAARSAYRDGASDAWIGARIAQAYVMPTRAIVVANNAAAEAKTAAEAKAVEAEAAAAAVAAAAAAAQKATNTAPVDPKAAKAAKVPAKVAARPITKANRAQQQKGLTEENLIRTANRLYETAGEVEPVFKNYQLLIKIAPTNQIVPLRLEYARVLENYDRYEQALTELNQVTNTNFTAKAIERVQLRIKRRDGG